MSLTGHMELGAGGWMPGPSSGFTNRETEAQRELRPGHSHTTRHWWQSWARGPECCCFPGQGASGREWLNLCPLWAPVSDLVDDRVALEQQEQQ